MSIADAAAALLATETGRAVRHRYNEPWRHYHDWSHPEAMLAQLERAEASIGVTDPVAAAAFVLWHDAVYDPQAAPGRNERLSVELCRADLTASIPVVSLERAMAAIMATVDHRPPHESACPDGALLLDIDLAVLAAPLATFETYDRGIAREYAHVPEPRYRSARAAVLRCFVQRDRLYLTDWAHTRWEQQARANLTAAIGRLEAS